MKQRITFMQQHFPIGSTRAIICTKYLLSKTLILVICSCIYAHILHAPLARWCSVYIHVPTAHERSGTGLSDLTEIS